MVVVAQPGFATPREPYSGNAQSTTHHKVLPQEQQTEVLPNLSGSSFSLTSIPSEKAKGLPSPAFETETGLK